MTATRRPSKAAVASATPAPPTGPGAVRVRIAGAASDGSEKPRLVERADSAILVDGARVGATLTSPVHGRAVLHADPSGSARRRRVILGDPRLTPDGGTEREVLVDGWRFVVHVEPDRRASLRERATRGRESAARSGPTEVRAIIPGQVLAVTVAAGDAVVAGQQLLLVEAMKMQNELRAPRAGTVARVAVEPGRTIEVGDVLLVLE